MKNIIKITSIISILFIAVSCAPKNNFDKAYYMNKSPKMEFSKYFNGTIDGNGMWQDDQGRVKKTFSTKIIGEWEGDKGIVKEYFSYANGNRDSRIWIVTAGSQITALAHDVVGSATGGQYGNAVNLQYDINLPKEDPINPKFHASDSFFAINSKSTVRIIDFGEYGKITIFYNKKTPVKIIPKRKMEEPKLKAEEKKKLKLKSLPAVQDPSNKY